MSLHNQVFLGALFHHYHYYSEISPNSRNTLEMVDSNKLYEIYLSLHYIFSFDKLGAVSVLNADPRLCQLLILEKSGRIFWHMGVQQLEERHATISLLHEYAEDISKAVINSNPILGASDFQHAMKQLGGRQDTPTQLMLGIDALRSDFDFKRNWYATSKWLIERFLSGETISGGTLMEFSEKAGLWMKLSPRLRKFISGSVTWINRTGHYEFDRGPDLNPRSKELLNKHVKELAESISKQSGKIPML